MTLHFSQWVEGLASLITCGSEGDVGDDPAQCLARANRPPTKLHVALPETRGG